ncbi:MAG TPA: hypothetical protein DCY13_13755 [Verrucomicrobiales bacterium]|nr:hypothetical protein [Verrucomicrobiales bacterium]
MTGMASSFARPCRRSRTRVHSAGVRSDFQLRRWISVALAALFLLSGTITGLAQSPAPPEILRDFDQDGRMDRLLQSSASSVIQSRQPDTGEWVDADFQLPEGVVTADANGADAGLRFVDLNGDGFDDLLLSNEERVAIHLWSKNVQPHLGWTKGWTQFVRDGSRSASKNEPPSLVGAGVSVAGSDLLIRRPPAGTRPEGITRIPLRSLIAFDAAPPLSPEEALKSFRVRAGFRIELVAAEPVVVDPVHFDWSADGRLWVVEMRDYPTGMDGRGKPGGVVKLLEDSDGDGRFDKAIPFLESLAFPTSLMPWRDGLLIAAAPDIFFAADTDGDGKADRREALLTGFSPGNQQHRVNGFVLGFDGWIHTANGDSGGKVRSVMTGEIIDIRGRDFRFKPDTGELETLSAQTQYGRRRDDWGNWFGNNNPTWLWHVTLPEHYLRRNPKLAVRSVRQVLANYDDSTRVFPISPALVRPNQPWSLNHVTSACSPTPYRDTLFGSGFDGSVFISEPVHNAIHREVLQPAGATFISHRAPGEEKSEFLASTDNWFRPTTTKVGPDGALYVLDWVSGWGSPLKGRIYRVTPPAPPGDAETKLISETRRLLAEGMGSRKDGELLELLGHPNRNVRLEAQWELAGRGRGSFDGLKNIAFTEAGTLPRLHAIWAVGQMARKIPINVGGDDFSDELFSLIPLMDDADPDVRLRAAELMADTALGNANLPLLALLADSDPRVQAQALVSHGKTVAAKGRRYALSPAEKAKNWLKDRLPKVGRQVSRLVNLELEFTFHPGGQTVSELVRTNQSTDPYFAWAATSYFRDLEIGESGWPSYRGVSHWPMLAATNEPASVNVAWVHALRRQTNAALAGFLTNRHPAVVLEAARAINDVPIPAALPALAAMLGREDLESEVREAPAAPRSPAEQILRRALNAHYRLGGPTNAQALVNYALRTNAPAALRAEALFLLSQWEVKSFATDAPKIARLEGQGSSPIINPENYPQWFNRVNGLWQPLDERDAAPAQSALAEAGGRLLADPIEEVRVAAIRSVAALRIPGVDASLFEIARAADDPVTVRSEALAALGAIKAPQLGEAVKLALADGNGRLRVAALEWIGQVDADPLIPELDRLLKDSSDRSAKQAILKALGRTQSEQGIAVLARELGRLQTDDFPAELRLDLIEAARRSASASLRTEFERYEANLPKDDPLAVHRVLLEGGDAARGRELFFHHPGAQCLRCHKVGNDGGIVGPDLGGIGRRQSREQLLEAILFPNAAIAAGFENVTLTLRDGRSHAGTVVREDEGKLIVNSPEEGGEIELSRADIESRVRGLSAMPEGIGDLLSRHEIRDLIEYLSSLK